MLANSNCVWGGLSFPLKTLLSFFIVITGSHLWNIEESSFVYEPSEHNGDKEISHDVLFREGQNRLKQVRQGCGYS